MITTGWGWIYTSTNHTNTKTFRWCDEREQRKRVETTPRTTTTYVCALCESVTAAMPRMAISARLPPSHLSSSPGLHDIIFGTDRVELCQLGGLWLVAARRTGIRPVPYIMGIRKEKGWALSSRCGGREGGGEPFPVHAASRSFLPTVDSTTSKARLGDVYRLGSWLWTTGRSQRPPLPPASTNQEPCFALSPPYRHPCWSTWWARYLRRKFAQPRKRSTRDGWDVKWWS